MKLKNGIKSTCLQAYLAFFLWNVCYNERGGDPFAKKTFISLAEAFYLATKGGGSFWGKAGSFEPGYFFDAVVIDDAPLADFNERTPYQRMERIISQSDDRHIFAKYVNGRQVV